jgi:hypothetical protein
MQVIDSHICAKINACPIGPDKSAALRFHFNCRTIFSQSSENRRLFLHASNMPSCMTAQLLCDAASTTGNAWGSACNHLLPQSNPSTTHVFTYPHSHYQPRPLHLHTNPLSLLFVSHSLHLHVATDLVRFLCKVLTPGIADTAQLGQRLVQ